MSSDGAGSTRTNFTNGRLVASALDAPWVFYPVAVVFTSIALGIVLNAVAPTEFHAVAWPVLIGWWALLALVWYLWIGRIPDRRRVASVRSAVPGALLIRAVHSNGSAQLWMAETLRELGAPRTRQLGTALVCSEQGFRIWMGPSTEPVPIATVAWRDVAELLPHRSSAVRFVIGKTKLAVDFRVVNGPWYRPVIARGASRTRILEQLEDLWHSAN